MDDDGWDLHAVVRSCAGSTSNSISGKETAYEEEFYRVGNESKYPNLDDNLLSGSGSGGLDEIYKAAGRVDPPLPPPITAASATSISFDGGGFGDEQEQQQTSISFSIHSQPLHTRKRRNKSKKMVIECREEELGNDGWAWRKYGQKPIKGSPYPRNYYRCSTSKDCLARKQVERSPTDPSNFIVSYSGNHLHQRPTHLSSLAGSTRGSKFNMMATERSSSSPPSASSFSPTSLKEDEIDMNDEEYI